MIKKLIIVSGIITALCIIFKKLADSESAYITPVDCPYYIDKDGDSYSYKYSS